MESIDVHLKVVLEFHLSAAFHKFVQGNFSCPSRRGGIIGHPQNGFPLKKCGNDSGMSMNNLFFKPYKNL